MRVLVTGATGFIGRHVVRALLQRKHTVVGLSRTPPAKTAFDWVSEVRFVSCDIQEPPADLEAQLGELDAVVHLAWPGLPNYKDLFHFEDNMLSDYRFLKRLVDHGVQEVLVTGTCFEYGMRSGPLSEEMETKPSNPYGFAKDTLRKALGYLAQKRDFRLKWTRLFYTYGPGQNPRSLLSQLDASIANGDSHFPMSGGEQLRDYLPVETIASRLIDVLEHPTFQGVLNICSGEPISIRKLVEDHIAKKGADIALTLGHYPYPTYEPMAFWGDSSQYQALMMDDIKK